MKFFSVWNVAQLKEISEKLEGKLVKGEGLERDYDKSLDKIWERACHLGKKYGTSTLWGEPTDEGESWK